ncbi:MAG: transcriptional regulator, partial [Bacteroidia bacterium]|nr:transcriptional regulator [Bacteroidia bacterium]
ELGITTQESSRNFDRLQKSGLITKNSDGLYHLSTFGKAICLQIPSLVFLSQNKPFFEKHSLDEIPLKFRQRIGALVEGRPIKGFVKVQEIWQTIYQKANEYVYNVLPELPLEIIKLAIKKADNNVEIKNVFSDSMIVPNGRKKILENQNFVNHIKKGTIERKMKNDVRIALVLNEKEAVVSFPNLDGETDLSQLFYSKSSSFHEWCLDLFRYCWYESGAFRENKLQS